MNTRIDTPTGLVEQAQAAIANLSDPPPVLDLFMNAVPPRDTDDDAEADAGVDVDGDPTPSGAPNIPNGQIAAGTATISQNPTKKTKKSAGEPLVATNDDDDDDAEESGVPETPVPVFDLSTVPECDRERVAALIPDPRIADGYVHRDALPDIYDFDMLDAAIDMRHNVLLTGPTGSSKTTVFRAYAAARGLPLAIIECNANMDPKSVLGRTTIDPTSGLPTWIDAPAMLVIRYGGVVVFDEVNLAHPRVTAAFHGVTSVMRRVDLSENGEIVAAGRGGTGDPQPVLLGAAVNPLSYSGTARMNQAFRNRFPISVDWPYLRSVEEVMVQSRTLLDFAESVRELAEVVSPVSTNMLIEFERHAKAFNVAAASEMFVNHFDDAEKVPVRRALEAISTTLAIELHD